jgi:hypothetical protein
MKTITELRPYDPRESRLRSKARRMGLRMTKSRRALGLDNHGGFMLINVSGNFAVAGSRYDLTLEDVERELGDD